MRATQTNAGRRAFKDDLAVSVPANLFPPHLEPDTVANARLKMKPDAMIVTGRKNNKTIHLVEVKYCRDTDRTIQEARAEAQHEALAGLLTTDGQTTKLHKILLGVGGTIFRDTLPTLMELGVDKQKAQAALEKVSKYAVQQMQYIVQIRRGMEAKAREAKGEPPLKFTNRNTCAPNRKRGG
jgi:hypothetical protein